MAGSKVTRASHSILSNSCSASNKVDAYTAGKKTGGKSMFVPVIAPLMPKKTSFRHSRI